MLTAVNPGEAGRSIEAAAARSRVPGGRRCRTDPVRFRRIGSLGDQRDRLRRSRRPVRRRVIADRRQPIAGPVRPGRGDFGWVRRTVRRPRIGRSRHAGSGRRRSGGIVGGWRCGRHRGQRRRGHIERLAERLQYGSFGSRVVRACGGFGWGRGLLLRFRPSRLAGRQNGRLQRRCRQRIGVRQREDGGQLGQIRDRRGRMPRRCRRLFGRQRNRDRLGRAGGATRRQGRRRFRPDGSRARSMEDQRRNQDA